SLDVARGGGGGGPAPGPSPRQSLDGPVARSGSGTAVPSPGRQSLDRQAQGQVQRGVGAGPARQGGDGDGDGDTGYAGVGSVVATTGFDRPPPPVPVKPYGSAALAGAVVLPASTTTTAAAAAAATPSSSSTNYSTLAAASASTTPSTSNLSPLSTASTSPSSSPLDALDPSSLMARLETLSEAAGSLERGVRGGGVGGDGRRGDDEGWDGGWSDGEEDRKVGKPAAGVKGGSPMVGGSTKPVPRPPPAVVTPSPTTTPNSRWEDLGVTIQQLKEDTSMDRDDRGYTSAADDEVDVPPPDQLDKLTLSGLERAYVHPTADKPVVLQEAAGRIAEGRYSENEFVSLSFTFFVALLHFAMGPGNPFETPPGDVVRVVAAYLARWPGLHPVDKEVLWRHVAFGELEAEELREAAVAGAPKRLVMGELVRR
ncbi:hypothetical protein HDU93_000643, partial [Gonapodya sp. JEL0774]